MCLKFSLGYAFIVEGETEQVFYSYLLQYMARKHQIDLQKSFDPNLYEPYFWFTTENETVIIKINKVGTITQIPNSYSWFISQCSEPYGHNCKWDVFLCYDTDNYKPDISKFYKGNWELLRSSLKGASANKIFDLAASADIEDVLLQDLEGICKFLGIKKPDTLLGNTGKKKMISLHKKGGKTYHEGTKARELIKSLDMEKIINGNLIELHLIEEEIYLSNTKTI